jgi:hypothetical protein
MLVKSTPAANFINIIRTIFLYERRFGSFFSSVEKAAKTAFVQKIRTYNADEIDPWSSLPTIGCL